MLPEGWWYHFLSTYITYFSNNFSEPKEMERAAVEALKLMTKIPPQSAWQDLVAYIISDIDNLSGWTKSWIKQSRGSRSESYTEALQYVKIQDSFVSTTALEYRIADNG